MGESLTGESLTGESLTGESLTGLRKRLVAISNPSLVNTDHWCQADTAIDRAVNPFLEF